MTKKRKSDGKEKMKKAKKKNLNERRIIPPYLLERKKEEDKSLKLGKTVRFIASVSDAKDCPQDGLPEVVFAGRSNAGKSSLVNALSGQQGLARVSQTPGKTQLLVYFKVDESFYLTDLPGYGFTATGKQHTKKFYQIADHYFSSGRPIDLVLFILDIRHSPSAEDQLMYEYLQASEYPFCLVFNKCDKLSKKQCNEEKIKRLRELKLSVDFPAFCVSTQTKFGLAELIRYLEARYFNEEKL